MEHVEVKKTGPREVFLHLLVMLALYFSAGSFLNLIFQYINIYFPDALAPSGVYNLQRIRFAISTLIVVFPVYVFTARYLSKIYESRPEIRQMRIRRWLVYFTLFIAAGIMIGDLVALVNSLLGGELTVRFILKVLTVFFVAGSVFSYYLWDLRQVKNE